MPLVLSCSPSVILAAAMAASGAVIYLSFSRHNQKTTTQFSSQLTDHQAPSTSNRALRSCLISSVENKTNKGKNKKRVHFADTVRRAPLTRRLITQHVQPTTTTDITSENKKNHHRPFPRHQIRAVHRVMPANRVALYSGILRDRVQLHRMACSY